MRMNHQTVILGRKARVDKATGRNERFSLRQKIITNFHRKEFFTWWM